MAGMEQNCTMILVKGSEPEARISMSCFKRLLANEKLWIKFGLS
jgi:hypothetical protein